MSYISEQYYDWLLSKIDNDGNTKHYVKLLRTLYSFQFVYSIDMDCNRETDGINLRYHFAYENGYSKNDILNTIGDKDCSILEVMVALAIRCDDQFMYDPNIGSRVSQWFWEMIDSLGLREMTDFNYDDHEVSYILNRFLGRAYPPNGDGSLFYIPNCNYDLREIEIWGQMCCYLNKIIF